MLLKYEDRKIYFEKNIGIMKKIAFLQ